MKTRRSPSFAGMLFALLTTIAAVPTANAAPLLTTGTGSLEQLVTTDAWQETFGGAVYSAQPLTNVLVGAAPVTITGFGVYGSANFASASTPVNVMWILFADGVYQQQYSSMQTVTNTTARWFDAPVGLTLAAGTTYSMGLVANDTFSWGISQPGSQQQTTGGGLTIQTGMPLAIVTLAGLPGSGFDGAIDAIDVYTPTPDWQPSLRIWGVGEAPQPPIPEPAEWTMLLAGLMVIAFVANRQRRRID